MLWCRTDGRFALLNNERRKKFQWGGAVVDPHVNLAGINIERLSRFISGHGATFVFKCERSFQDVARQRTGMGMPDFACSRRELQKIHDRLVARRSILLKQRLALDPGLLRMSQCSSRQEDQPSCQHCAPSHDHSPVCLKDSKRKRGELELAAVLERTFSN